MTQNEIDKGNKIYEILAERQLKYDKKINYFWILFDEAWKFELQNLPALSKFEPLTDAFEILFVIQKQCSKSNVNDTTNCWTLKHVGNSQGEKSRICSVDQLQRFVNFDKLYPKTNYDDTKVALILAYWLDGSDISDHNTKQGSFNKLKAKVMNYNAEIVGNAKESQWTVTYLPKTVDLDSVHEFVQLRICVLLYNF